LSSKDDKLITPVYKYFKKASYTTYEWWSFLMILFQKILKC